MSLKVEAHLWRMAHVSSHADVWVQLLERKHACDGVLLARFVLIDRSSHGAPDGESLVGEGVAEKVANGEGVWWCRRLLDLPKMPKESIGTRCGY